MITNISFLALEDPLPDEHNQAVRRVYENEDLKTAASLFKFFRLACHFDDISGKHIVLWEDILAAFKDAVHVLSGEKVLPFLEKGPDFKTHDPLCVAAVHDITLDVVVTGQLVSPESTSHSSLSSSNLATNTVRQNPAYGLVGELLENYTHIDNPSTALACQGTRPTPNNQFPVQGNYDDSKPQHSLSNAQLTHALQEYTSGITRDFAQTLMRVQLGDKDAQVSVEDMYRDGQGIAQDYQAAMDWCLKAAEQDDPIGQRKVGVLYDKGLGVTQNDSAAMAPYLKGAKQGSPPAQHNIGYLCDHGLGVSQDDAQAVDWYRKAAEQGFADAHYNLGMMYNESESAPKDQGKAMGWYKKAADQGDVEAQFVIDLWYNECLGAWKKDARQGDEAAIEMIDILEQQGSSVQAKKNKARSVEEIV